MSEARIEVRLYSLVEAAVLRKMADEAMAVSETDAEYFTPEEAAVALKVRRRVRQAERRALGRWERPR